MTINLYKNSSDKKVLDKNLIAVAENVECVINENTDLLNPNIILSTVNAHWSEVNYIYIPSWKRYYYISDPSTMTGGRVSIQCKVDVLMSHKAGIRAITGTIDRQENKYNGYLIDNEYIAKAYKQIVAKTFPAGLTDDSLILMTVG